MGLFRDDRRIRPAKNGEGFDVRMPDEERELLASLPTELVELLDTAAGDLGAIHDDPALARLFPDAYTAVDTGFNEEYRRLMTEDLRDRHRIALETLAAGATANHITVEELHAWMTALNQLRLVIGTRLDVTEDLDPRTISADHPNAAAFALYSYLSWLQ
ncbi:MAG: hypothetical protein QOJ00_1932, partial [Actinomycetota bacterium]